MRRWRHAMASASVWVRGKGTFDAASYEAAEIMEIAYEYVLDGAEEAKVLATSILIGAERHVLETGRVS
jgi:hypothetical protein